MNSKAEKREEQPATADDAGESAEATSETRVVVKETNPIIPVPEESTLLLVMALGLLLFMMAEDVYAPIAYAGIVFAYFALLEAMFLIPMTWAEERNDN